MKTILLTGAQGFIGRNLTAHLKLRNDVRLLAYDVGNTDAELRQWAAEADVIFHLAGVNRPQNVEEYESGNAGLTQAICGILGELGRKPQILFTSSIQAALDNPYGLSKRHAEDVLRQFAERNGAPVAIFRLKNVFGKWCRPNYNSVVATFCYNIAHDLPIEVSDPNRELELVHVDDVVAALLAEMDRLGKGDRSNLCEAGHRPKVGRGPFRQIGPVPFSQPPIPSHSLTLGDLAGRIQFFREMQHSLRLPDFSSSLNRQLYSTYLSYVEPPHAEYGLDIKRDDRGNLAEFIKSPHFGQIFVSRTRPGITRGNHYHHLKTEKFLVLAGEGLIRLRHIDRTEVHEYPVRGEEYRVIDILPGYTHSITNTGPTELITLFWSSEVFNPDRLDTYYLPVE